MFVLRLRSAFDDKMYSSANEACSRAGSLVDANALFGQTYFDESNPFGGGVRLDEIYVLGSTHISSFKIQSF